MAPSRVPPSLRAIAWIVAAAAGLLFFLAVGLGARGAAADVALVGATLVDGTGAAAVPDAVVLVGDGRIACAGPRADCPVPEGTRVVDVAGRWIVPGLIDAHVHYSQTGWADGRPDAMDVRDRSRTPRPSPRSRRVRSGSTGRTSARA